MVCIFGSSFNKLKCLYLVPGLCICTCVSVCVSGVRVRTWDWFLPWGPCPGQVLAQPCTGQLSFNRVALAMLSPVTWCGCSSSLSLCRAASLPVWGLCTYPPLRRCPLLLGFELFCMWVSILISSCVRAPGQELTTRAVLCCPPSFPLYPTAGIPRTKLP